MLGVFYYLNLYKGNFMSWSSIGVPSVPGIPNNIGDAAIKFGGA